MIQDLKYAVRWLARSPGFAAVAVLSLGLGVGVNTAMFSLVDALLLRPLPVSDPASLVDVFTSGGDGDVHATNSYPDYEDLKARNTVFADMMGYSPMMAAVSLGERSRLMLGQLVTSNHFEMLGIRPARGRLLVPSDDRPGAERVVVLSDRMWRREFAADPDAVGRTLRIRGQIYTVVGVAPASFTGVVPLFTPEFWMPVVHIDDVEPAGITDSVPGPGDTPLERRGYRWMFVKGRLKPGLTVDQARANVQVIGAQLAQDYTTNDDRTMTAVATNDVRMLVPEASGPLSAAGAGLMAVVSVVLLIACANVAGLLLARASSRRREMSVRAAIGASRRRLVQQLLIEGGVIGLAGTVVAIGVAQGLLRVLLAIELPIRDLPLDVRIDGRVLAFAVLIALCAGLLASLMPAVRASSPSLVRDLRGPASAASASQAANVGFDPHGLALVSFDTDMVRYDTARGRQFWDEAVARVAAMPGVEAVTRSSPRVPFDLNFSTTEFRLDDRTYAPDQRGEIITYVGVGPAYFATLGVPIRQGRAFNTGDREGAPFVAIVSEAMARRFWPDGSAVGRTMTVASTGRRYEIVGVSADYKARSVMETPTPYVHFAAAQRPSTYNYLMARTRGDAAALVGDIRRELLSMEPGLVFVGSGTMEHMFAGTLLPARVGAMLAAGFGGLGLALAAIGLYGVMAFSVAQRTREIGIRVALGAERSGVLRVILSRAALVVGAGGVLGLGVSALAATALAGVLYGVTAADPFAWAAAVATVVVSAGLASLIPAMRAVRIDPARTLRAE
jgi:ABC-type antimicrobial peptide transport system permease subunit